MGKIEPVYTRRALLGGLALGAAAYTTRGAFAAQLVQTPAMTQGPFYPDKLPLDTDNDLLVINDAITPAVGVITHLTGRILDSRGDPVRNAVVEIWQVDNNAAYLHSRSGNAAQRDKNFQGYGRFLTGSTGEYYFRTIKPVPYPGRTPHIHFQAKVKGHETLTSQVFIKGDPGNDRDGVLNGVRDAAARASVLVDFVPLPESRIGELTARFEVVLGFTPNM